MTDFTDYVENLVLDWMSQGSNMPSPPSNLYVALHTDDPGESPDGSTEVSAADYDRIQTSPTDWDRSQNTFENANALDWGLISNDWGVITHMSLWDGSATSDNTLAAFPLETEHIANEANEVTFNTGTVTFTID